MLYFFTSARAYFSVSLYHSNFRQTYHTKIRSEMLILKVNPLNQPNLLSVVCVLLCVDINAHIYGHFFSFLFYFLVVDISDYLSQKAIRSSSIYIESHLQLTLPQHIYIRSTDPHISGLRFYNNNHHHRVIYIAHTHARKEHALRA